MIKCRALSHVLNDVMTMVLSWIMNRNNWRFERCVRLFGVSAMKKLDESHVAVFGLGGVGSYAAEGLARSGVGRLTLVDFDNVCVTNINRQLPARCDTIGVSKAELMASHVRLINPDVRVNGFVEFYNKDTSSRLLADKPDIVIDCIDNVTAKMHLVATCLEQGVPIVVTLGAGAKLDPTRVRIVRLTETHTDPLGRALRKHIRRKHDVSEKQLADVIAVFSDEPVIKPYTEHGGVICGVNCVCPGNGNNVHSCRKKHVIYGTAVFVTSVFGMAAASAAVRILLNKNPFSRELECDICGNIFDPTGNIRERKKQKSEH